MGSNMRFLVLFSLVLFAVSEVVFSAYFPLEESQGQDEKRACPRNCGMFSNTWGPGCCINGQCHDGHACWLHAGEDYQGKRGKHGFLQGKKGETWFLAGEKGETWFPAGEKRKTWFLPR